MTQCDGKYFDGLSAKPYTAVLSRNAGESHYRLTLAESGETLHFEAGALQADPPLGKNSPRTVRLPGGAKFYTTQSDELDMLGAAEGPQLKNPQVWASILEGYKHAILLSIALLLSILFLGYRYGIPIVADSVAGKMPQSVLQTISNNTLNVLDKYVGFEPTTLSIQRQAELRGFFDELTVQLGTPGYAYKLEFRDFPPNAFALPSGTIVFSDELIEELPTDNAIIAVMAHEIAHVEKRHGIRQLFRQAGVAFVLSTLLNDLSSAPALLSALPELLISSGYSRSFESEADLFSAHYLCEHYGSSQPMADALRTLQEMSGNMESESTELISTHPLLGKRIAIVEAVECE